MKAQTYAIENHANKVSAFREIHEGHFKAAKNAVNMKIAEKKVDKVMHAHQQANARAMEEYNNRMAENMRQQREAQEARRLEK